MARANGRAAKGRARGSGVRGCMELEARSRELAFSPPSAREGSGVRAGQPARVTAEIAAGGCERAGQGRVAEGSKGRAFGAGAE